MSKFLKGFILPIFTFGCGAVGIGLQSWLLGAVDEKGLLVSNPVGQILLLLLSAGALGVLFWFTRPLVQAPKYSFNFPPSVIGAVGAAIAAVGVLITGIDLLLPGGDVLTKAAAFMGLLCAAALAWSGYNRWQGKQVHVALHSVICLFFLLLLIYQYRLWSAEAQLQAYIFQLLATVFLMIGAYQRACFDESQGDRRSYAFFRLAGAYFCFVAIPGSEIWFLYLSAMLWSVTDLCNLTPMPKKGR